MITIPIVVLRSILYPSIKGQLEPTYFCLRLISSLIPLDVLSNVVDEHFLTFFVNDSAIIAVAPPTDVID